MKMKNNLEEDGFINMEDFSSLYEIFGTKIEQRNLYLFSQVDSESMLSLIEGIHFFENKSKEKDINLYINSDGGYVDDCLALIDVMDSSPCDIRTIVLGRAASAACLISSNGTIGKRIAGKNADFMFHESYGMLPEVRGTELPYWKNEFERTENKIRKIFSKNTGQPIDKIVETFLSKNLDRWMTALEAHKFGIIDKIMTSKRRPIKNGTKKSKK